jgi:hypothetical protein
MVSTFSVSVFISVKALSNYPVVFRCYVSRQCHKPEPPKLKSFSPPSQLDGPV